MAHRNTMTRMVRQCVAMLISLLLTFTCSTSMTAQNAVGSVNGSLTVNDMGAAVYSMTFDAPNGGRMTPKIGLAYNSQSAGYGLAGYGIDITGISVITSGGRDIFHNGKVRGANYDADSNFYLDGKRLVLQEGEDGMDGAEYSPEGDPHTKVALHGDITQDNAAVYFEVKTNDGTTYIYGQTIDSKLQLTKNSTMRTAAWYISKAVNRYGENISYTYSNENLCVSPQTITYGTERGLTAKVEFCYISMASGNVRTFRIGTQQGVRNKLLSSVKTSINGHTHRKYDFTYDEAASDRYSRLTTITESNATSGQLNPTVLTWNTCESAEVVRTDMTGIQTKFNDAFGVDVGENSYMTVDLNGDGVADLVRMCGGKQGSESLGWTPYVFVYVYVAQKDENGNVRYSSPLRYQMPGHKWLDNEDVEMDMLWLCKPFIKHTMGSASVLDHDGDGYNDLVFHVYSDLDGTKNEHLYFLLGKEVAKGSNLSNLLCSAISVIRGDDSMCRTSLDINGDGRDDLIGVEKTGDAGNYRMTLLSCKEVNEDGVPQEDYKEKDIMLPSSPKRLFTGDYNGDGLPDLLFACENGYAIYYNNGYTQGQSILNVFTSDNRSEGTSIKDYWRMEQGDFDGDGLVDFFCHDNDTRQFSVAYYNGEGTFGMQSLTDNWGIYDDSGTDKDNGKFSVVVTDYDNDGRIDVIISKAMYDFHHGAIWESSYYRYNKTLVRWLRNTGNGFELQSSYEFNGEMQSSESRIVASDLDGDGKMEFASIGFLLDANNSIDDEGTIHIYKTGTADASDGRIASLTDGFGNVTTLSYAYATDKTVYSLSEEPMKQYEYSTWGFNNVLYQKVESETTIDQYPVNRYTLPIALVSSVRSSDADISYGYKDLRLHIAGKGIMGFGTVKKKDNRQGVIETTEVSKWDTQYWLPIETTVTNTITTTEEMSTARMQHVIRNQGIQYSNATDYTDYNGNKSKEWISLDYETGLPESSFKQVGEDGCSIYTEEAYSDYEYINGTWLPHHKDVENFRDDDGNSALYYEDYSYDNHGNMTRRVTTGMKLDDDQWDFEVDDSISTDYTYDRWGNVTSETFHGNDETTGYKYYEYDPTGRFLVKTYTVPESTTMTCTYDVFGNVLTETDETSFSNPLTTTYEYDAWGRRTDVVYPDGTVSSYETDWSSASGTGGWYTYESHTAAPWVKTTYDSRGRERKIETVGVKGVSVSKETSYNTKGQVSSITNREGQRTSTETFTYDARGRITSDFHSSGAGVTYEYGNKTVASTDAAGRCVTKTFDAADNVLTVTDPAQNIDYQYYSNGKPHVISAGGVETVMEYDGFGRRTKLIDPDAGTTTTTYGKNGLIKTETDGRGVKTTYAYDALGRVTQRKREGNVSGYKQTDNTTYVYGTDGNSKGRIVEKKNGWSSIRYEYDKYGRITAEVRPNTFCHCGNNHDLRRTYAYNSLGQLESVTYPILHSATGLTIKNKYDAYGHKTGETHNGGNLSSILSNSGVRISRYSPKFGYRYSGYDKYGYPTYHYYKKGKIVKDSLCYEYDRLTGNLTSKTINGTTENYTYDDLDRLVEVDGANPLSVTYAANGNITNKSDIGNYIYNPADKPHALREIASVESNLSLSDNSVSYTLSGKPGWIYEYSYSYGPDDEKWRYGRIDNDDPETKYRDIDKIYWGNYECLMKDFHFREYYFLDNDVILIRDSYTGEDADTHPTTLSYYQAITDNLGSIIAVYDDKQDKVYEASYDAWGRQTVTLDEIGLYRGFTGHENVGRSELVHMDNRVYDSSIGRFLSPDNYVQLPENSQSFNRYSYCINNPLKYTDPTGELFGIDDAIVAFAIGGFNAAMATCNGENVWKAVGINILSSAASYGMGAAFNGIGGLFGHSVGSFGNELLRAGAHGLASGVCSALQGNNFGAGFASGALASFAGSGAQWLGLGEYGVLGATTMFGGIGSAAFGGNFIDGAMTGLNIGLYNHCFHYDAEVDLPEVVVTGKARPRLNLSAISTTPAYPIDNIRGAGTVSNVLALAAGVVWIYNNRAAIEEGITRAYNSINTMATKTMECRPGYVYHLVATSDGLYPNVRGGSVYLKKGDTWKIGETINGEARYGREWLTNHYLKMEQASGWMTDKCQLWIEEKRQLIMYAGKNRCLPPGNKIFK